MMTRLQRLMILKNKLETMRYLIILIAVVVLSILSQCSNAREPRSADSGAPESDKSWQDTLVFSSPDNYLLVLDNVDVSSDFEIRSYKDMFSLFDSLDYTPEAWQAGIRVIPRVYLPLIGERWGPSKSKELTIENKKRLFFRGLAPLILRSNELIMVDRMRLEKIRSSFNQQSGLEDLDQKWIMKLAALYKVKINEGELSAAVLDELWIKVDIVPVSLALGQAAEESGWGTSRFAAQGNAVYGQWTWGKKAIKPEQQREELGNYGIAAFGTLQESVCSYMLNLNTHNAYAGLRDKRAKLRDNGGKISGTVLAGELISYSERGEEYVKGLISLMEFNQLIPTDDAYLSDDPPIYLVQVAE